LLHLLGQHSGQARDVGARFRQRILPQLEDRAGGDERRQQGDQARDAEDFPEAVTLHATRLFPQGNRDQPCKMWR